MSEKEIDAAGDGLSWICYFVILAWLIFFGNIVILFFFVGDVLVILDLQADQSLFEAGVAREVDDVFFICVLAHCCLNFIYTNEKRETI